MARKQSKDWGLPFSLKAKKVWKDFDFIRQYLAPDSDRNSWEELFYGLLLRGGVKRDKIGIMVARYFHDLKKIDNPGRDQLDTTRYGRDSRSDGSN